MKPINSVDDFDDRLHAIIDEHPDSGPAAIAARLLTEINPAAYPAILAYLIEPQVATVQRACARLVEQRARRHEPRPSYDPDTFVRLYDDPKLWSGNGIWFGSRHRYTFRSWCIDRHGKAGYDAWLSRAIDDGATEDFKCDWLPDYSQQRMMDGVAKMLHEFADAIRFETTAELLDTMFALGDGTNVSWRDATVAHHEERIGLLSKMIAGTSETAAMHLVAVRMIKDAGVETLGQIGDANGST